MASTEELAKALWDTPLVPRPVVIISPPSWIEVNLPVFAIWIVVAVAFSCVCCLIAK